NAGSVQWTVTFSETVSGVDTSDFSLASGAPAGTTISSVSGSGAVYTVTVTTGSDGTVGLNLVDDDSIADAASNKLGGTGTGNGNTTGPTYSVDKTAPTVAVAQVGSATTNASSVSWTVTFSESVSGVDSTDFTVTKTGLGGTPAVT